MAAATAQGTYINPMAALATQIPHATLNGMANSVVPPTSGELRVLWIPQFRPVYNYFYCLTSSSSTLFIT